MRRSWRVAIRWANLAVELYEIQWAFRWRRFAVRLLDRRACEDRDAASTEAIPWDILLDFAEHYLHTDQR